MIRPAAVRIAGDARECSGIETFLLKICTMMSLSTRPQLRARWARRPFLDVLEDRLLLSANRIRDDLQVLYLFDEETGSTVADVSGVGSPLDLQIDSLANVNRQAGSIDVINPALISSSGPATKVIDAVMASGEITVEAWVTPANTTQTGPARIVGISEGSFTANLNLGQNRQRFDAKLRATTTNLKGNPATVSPRNSATTDLTHVVYTRDTSGTATVYLDGSSVSSRTVNGSLANWDPDYPLGLANTMNGTKPWLGSFDLVAVYSAALTPQEIIQNFSAGPDPLSGPTIPVADIVDVSPDPAESAVGEVTVDFSEDVTGVDIDDFGLTLDGDPVDLTGIVVSEVSADRYTLDLSSVTDNEGDYLLTLVAEESGIESVAGVPLIEDATDAFEVSFPAPVAPTAAISEVTPDPRSSVVEDVTIAFSEGVSGVDISDFALTLEGNPVDLTGLTVNEVATDEYTIDLSTVTDDEGGYELTLVAAGSGIENVGGVSLAADATDSFVVDTTSPTGSIATILSGTSVGEVDVSFDEPVSGVDAADFVLTRDGNNVSLGTLEITAASLSEYSLDLGPFTNEPGDYQLTLMAASSSIVDLADNPLVADVSSTIFTITESPTAERVSEDLQVLYLFESGGGQTVYDVSDVGVPLDLEIEDPSNVSWDIGALDVVDPTLISSSGPATKVIDAVTASGEITVEAWVTPANTTQTGPARIVGISEGGFTANLNLGQNRNRYNAKLRTTSTTFTGNPSTASPTNAVSTALTHVVYTRDVVGQTRLYLDGTLQTSRIIGGSLGNWDPNYPLALANTEQRRQTVVGNARPGRDLLLLH